jgi:ABC-2 type transport system permease protein
METIYILWKRQIIKYFRSKSRIIGSLGQPMLFLIAFGFGFSHTYQQAGEGNYIQFLAPGIILMSVVFTAIFSGIDIIWDRQFGFLKETLVAPVSRLQITLGKTLGGATVAMFQGIIVFTLTLFVGFRPNFYMIPLALFLAFLNAIIFTSLGTAIASLLEDMQGFQLIMNFLVFPIIFLSGAFFPLQGLPTAMQYVVRIDPLTYGVDGLRGLLIGASYYGIMVDFIVLGAVATIFLGVGSYLFSRIKT